MKKIVLVLFILALAGGGAYFYFNRNGNLPQDVLKEYVSKINEQDYYSMYEMLSTESKTRITQEDFITRNKNIYTRNRFNKNGNFNKQCKYRIFKKINNKI